ncbi:DEAD/DEAH box helicase [Vagococcus intermedius]|uniref:DEAD/DEAH box helicase n=1 Tax=Vagococcus intermedius TaxID=2991418 RepID=A0AAF0CWL4_9ENTE|nr:DEAD/DEAH box helicase [Vagococcus intermedius]WEG74349.1 DEAD/DEAH box helicase [Vagococcus intermedius]WEG76433.1 DEAD/DEAH box helicase [Vagococcus intermedius]
MKWSIPEKTVQLGRRYADDGRVTGITQDLTHEIWHADVIGSKIYQIELDGTPKENDRCTCQFWHEHHYCKHTVAVELTLRDKGLNRVLKQNPTLKQTYKAPSLASLFTNGFTKLQQEMTEKVLQEHQALQIGFQIDSVEVSSYHPEKNVFGLALKIGFLNERLYVVKNVGEFLKLFEQQGVYRLDEQREFSLNYTNFNESDRQLLREILAIYRSNQLLASNGIQVKGSIKQRYLLLPNHAVKELILKLQQAQKLQLVINKKQREYIRFTTETLPLTFRIKPKKSGYLLMIDNPLDGYWSSYSWANCGQTMYELSKRQQEIYDMLQQLLKRTEKPEVFYDQTEVADLFSYVLPELSEIGEIVVDDILAQELVHYPLKSQIVLSISEDKLCARVDFRYGEEIVSTDPNLTTKTELTSLVVRDNIQESRLLKLLEHAGYVKRATNFQKTLPSGQALYELFTSELPKFRQVTEVVVEDSLSSQYLEAVQYQPQIDLSEEGSWLDIRFDISNIDETEITALVGSLLEKKAFHQLENGQIISLETEDFQQTSEALAKLRGYLSYQDGHLVVPKHLGLQVEEAFEGITETEFSLDFTELVEELTHPAAYDVALPKGLRATLRSYQEEGYRWFKVLSKYHFGGILADDMGLGKTVQAIAYLLSEKETGRVKEPSIVVAPASLIYNWQVECAKFAPNLKTIIVTGSKKDRQKLLAETSAYDVIITSYAGVRQDIEFYQETKWHCLILDEAQAIKNSATKTFQAMKDLKTVQRFALSGTPVENDIEELWALFHMLMPGFFPPKTKFKKMATEEIARMIQPFILRRDKRHVLKDLPDKIETNLYSALTDEQKKVYMAYLRQMQASVNGMSSTDFKQNRMSILAGLTRLRQICCDPRLFIEDYAGESGKLEQVKDLILSAKANGRRILLFSQFTSMLSLIETELQELAIDSFYLRGSTKPEERLKMVDAFNEGEKDVFLISLKAGGTGLNLTGADTVILYDLWWNPAVEEQAAGRAHRMGQKKVVEVWRLIAEGTIEEKMDQLQQDKRDLFAKVMTTPAEKELGKLTEDDIREILNGGVLDLPE